MNSTFSIRPAAGPDTERLKQLMLEYIVDFYGCAHPGDEKLDALLAMLMERRGGRQWVAESGGRLIGFVTLYETFSTLRAQKAAVMNDLYVREPFRGAGAAAALFAAIRDAAAAEGYTFLSWETAEDNIRAQRFYEKMGGERGTWVSYSYPLQP